MIGSYRADPKSHLAQIVKPNLTLSAHGDTWLRFLRKENNLVLAMPLDVPIIAKWRKSRSNPTEPCTKNVAPFKRNNVMLETPPIGIIVFPDSCIVENRADKARTMGIPVGHFERKSGA